MAVKMEIVQNARVKTALAIHVIVKSKNHPYGSNIIGILTMNTRELYKAYYPDIRAFIYNKVEDDTTTDDLVQETFMKVHMKLDTLNDTFKAKSWLFSIAHHTTMDFFRKQKSTKLEPTLEQTEETEYSDHTELDCLRGILLSIPKKYRTPVYLYDIKGIKQQEIARILGRPLPTVKSQIQRGRKMVAQGYINCCGYTINDKGKLVGEIQEKENCKVCR